MLIVEVAAKIRDNLNNPWVNILSGKKPKIALGKSGILLLFLLPNRLNKQVNHAF